MMEKMSQKTKHTNNTLKMDGIACTRAFTTTWKEEVLGGGVWVCFGKMGVSGGRVGKVGVWGEGLERLGFGGRGGSKKTWGFGRRGRFGGGGSWEFGGGESWEFGGGLVEVLGGVLEKGGLGRFIKKCFRVM